MIPLNLKKLEERARALVVSGCIKADGSGNFVVDAIDPLTVLSLIAALREAEGALEECLNSGAWDAASKWTYLAEKTLAKIRGEK